MSFYFNHFPVLKLNLGGCFYVASVSTEEFVYFLVEHSLKVLILKSDYFSFFVQIRITLSCFYSQMIDVKDRKLQGLTFT